MAKDVSGRPEARYLVRRGDVLYYRRRIPAADQHRFGGRREFIRTLKAGTAKDAQRQLGIVIAEYEALLQGGVDAVQSPMPLPMLNKATAERLARQQLNLMKRMNAWAFALEPSEDAETAAKDHRRFAVQERQAVSDGRVPLGQLMTATSLLREAGIPVEGNEAFVALLVEALGQARAEFSMQTAYALEGETGRVANPALFGPEAYSADERRKTAVSVADAASRFLSNPTRQISASTLQQYRPRMKVIVEALGPRKALDEVRKTDCRRLLEDVILRLPSNSAKKYRNMTLQAAIEQGAKDGAPLMSAKTQRLYVELLKAFFDWAEQDDLIEASPARKVQTPKGRDEKLRSGFTIDQLRTIFSAPLYLGCQDDEAGYGTEGGARPRRHRFWIPIIALYSGMRLNEIALLRKSDLIQDWGVDAFNLVEDRKSGRTLKTQESARKVPVHPELKQLGLLDYAAALPVGAYLFPELVRQTRNPGDAFGKWFGGFCNSVGLTDRSLVFHSFRHTFATGCRACGLPKEQFEAIAGWKARGVSGGYGTQSLPALAEALGRLEYRGLDLSGLGRT